MKLRYIKLALTVFTTSWLLTSCLKDSAGIMDPAESNNVIEFANTGSIIESPTSTASVQFNADLGVLYRYDTSSFKVNVSYSGADQAPQDITVTIEVDTSLLRLYNTAHSADDADFENPPTSVTNVFPQTVVIKKGTQKAQITVPVLVSDDYDFSKTYALPLKITSSSSGIISGNYGTALYALVIRNDYDGVYQYTTSASTSLVPNQNKEVNMVTVGQYTVQITPGLLANYTNVVQYTINPTTNKILVTCPSLGVFTPQDTRSEYDPTTHNMKVYWKQANGARTFEETFTYKGPRD